MSKKSLRLFIARKCHDRWWSARKSSSPGTRNTLCMGVCAYVTVYWFVEWDEFAERTNKKNNWRTVTDLESGLPHFVLESTRWCDSDELTSLAFLIINVVGIHSSQDEPLESVSDSIKWDILLVWKGPVTYSTVSARVLSCCSFQLVWLRRMLCVRDMPINGRCWRSVFVLEAPRMGTWRYTHLVSDKLVRSRPSCSAVPVFHVL